MISFAKILIICCVAEISFAQAPVCKCDQVKNCLKSRSDQRKHVVEQCMESHDCANVINKLGSSQAAKIKSCITNFHTNLFGLGDQATSCILGSSSVCKPTTQSGQSVDAALNSFKLAGGRGRRQAPPHAAPPPNGAPQPNYASSSGMGGPAQDQELETDLMPHCPSPQVNAYHECFWDCAEAKSKDQGLLNTYPKNTGRRKRTPETMHIDVQFCAVDGSCHLDLNAFANMTSACSSQPSHIPQWTNLMSTTCKCLQSALGMHEDTFPCNVMNNPVG